MGELAVKNVYKDFCDTRGNKHVVLDNVSFRLMDGECLSVIGESGSGKSTIMKIALGLMKPTNGDILLNGRSVLEFSNKEWRKQRSALQGVFQDASGTLNEYMSTYENIEEVLRNLTDWKKNERRKLINELMEQMGISSSLLHTPVRSLSGGEQRRISLLRALSIKPQFLLLDEVVSGLDAISCNMVLSTLEEYKKQYGCAYLFITHDLYSAYRLSDNIIKLESGRIKAIGSKIN